MNSQSQKIKQDGFLFLKRQNKNNNWRAKWD